MLAPNIKFVTVTMYDFGAQTQSWASKARIKLHANFSQDDGFFK
jgi:hypothetical protein